MRVRWPDVVPAGRDGIGKRLREEIQRVFGVKLCPETLRPLLGELPRQSAAAAGPVAGAPATTAGGLPQSSQNAPDHQGVSSPAREQVGDCAPGEAPPESAGQALALAALPQTLWGDHLGMRLFARVLVAVAQVVEPAGALFKQWLASLLLGALNLAPTQFLNWADLSRRLGAGVRFPHPQREQLERVATPANVEALVRFNARQLGAESQSQFYFDPHPKHYTGQEPVLKGGCGALRWADKALHRDFIHPVAGQPL